MNHILTIGQSGQGRAVIGHWMDSIELRCTLIKVWLEVYIHGVHEPSSGIKRGKKKKIHPYLIRGMCVYVCG